MSRLVSLLRMVEWGFGALLVYTAAINAVAPARVLDPLRAALGDVASAPLSWSVVVMVGLVLSQCWVGASLLRFRGFHGRTSAAGLAIAGGLAWIHGGVLQGVGGEAVDVFSAAHLLEWSWVAAMVSGALLVLGPRVPQGQGPRPGIRRFLKSVTRAALSLFVACFAGISAVSQESSGQGQDVGSRGVAAHEVLGGDAAPPVGAVR